MPIITMWAWTSLDLLSAWLRLVRRSSSKPETPRESSRRGSTLISRLNCASSVWNSGLAIASSASALFSAGLPSSSTRLNSISMPVIGFSMSNRDSRSIRAKTSRQRRTFSR